MQKLRQISIRLALTFKVFILFVLVFFTSLAVYTYTRTIDPTKAYAATSSTLNFQGRLLSSSGNVVPDGNYNLEFKIYDGGTNGGPVGAGELNSGTLLWIETRDFPGTDDRVRVVNGYFSVTLGSVTAFPGTINWDQELWLTMNVGGSGTTPAWDGEMLAPSNKRTKLTAVPYAFRAKSALGVASNNTNSAITNSGNITIQTGDASGLLSNSGNLIIDNGTATQTAGTISLGTTNTSGITIGRAGVTTLLQGAISLTGGTNYGVYYRDGSGNLATTAAGISGQCFLSNTALAPSWGSCAGSVTLQNSYTNSTNPEITLDSTRGALTIRDNLVALGANLFEVQNNAGTSTYFGVSATGASVLGGLSQSDGLVSLAANAASTISTSSGGLTLTSAAAATWSTTAGNLTIQAGSGTVTLGTSTALTATAGLTVSSGGSGALTLDSASNTLLIAADDTGLQRVATGSYKIDLKDSGATTLSLDNTGSGAASLNLVDGELKLAGTSVLTNARVLQNLTGLTVAGGTVSLNAASNNAISINTASSSGTVTIGGGSAPFTIDSTAFDVSTAGALSGITTINASGAITGATSTNTINGLVVNSGTLSAITGYTQTSGNFDQSGSGTFGTGTGAVSLNGATTLSTTTNSAVGLTVNGTTGTAATALSIAQTGNAADLVITNTASTSGALVSLTHSTSAFTGTGLLVNLASGSGNFASGNFADFQLNGTSRFKIDNTGALQITSDSATGLNIQSTGGLSYFSVDVANAAVRIGSSTADATGTLLVIDTKNTSGDPTGINGGSYYNSNTAKTRCYQNSSWQDCITRNRVTISADVTNNNIVANSIADVTNLSFSVTSGVKYQFECNIWYTAGATTTGSRWSINGPATTSLAYESRYALSTTTQTLNNLTAYDTPAASSTSSTATTGNNATIKGFIQPSASGTVIVRFASEVSNSAIIAKAGSSCEYWTP